jgi:hypothetical protein
MEQKNQFHPDMIVGLYNELLSETLAVKQRSQIKGKQTTETFIQCLR